MVVKSYSREDLNRLQDSAYYLYAYSHILNLIYAQGNAKFGTQAIANMMCGLSQGHEYLKFHKKLSKFREVHAFLIQQAMLECEQMKPAEAASVLCSIAKVGTFWKEQNQNFQAFLDVVMSNKHLIQSMGARETSNILWAMAKFEKNSLYNIQILVEQLRKNKDTLAAQDISHALWALKKHRFRHSTFLDELQFRIIQIVQDFSAQDISMIILALADLRTTPNVGRELVEQLTNQFLAKQSKQKRDIWSGFNMVFGLSVLSAPVHLCQQVVNQLIGFLQGSLYYSRMVKTMPRRHWKALCQLRRAQLQYQVLQQQLELPRDIESLATRAMKKEVRFSVQHPHQFLQKIYKRVVYEFPFAQYRVPIKRGELVVDIVLATNVSVGGRSAVGKNVCIQAAPMGAFTANDPKALLGSVEAYYQMLESEGWSIIVVSHDDWEQPEFVKNLLQGIVRLLYG
eukprot:TRINITY_DN6424_c0_g1_i1.p1 TRINITY_DN6424_c0_g1~~TRINITY_DN6424_c0_g1_i1.p1  ORF type:complete len:455 (-),score=23.15 TRINITY_DN6424_c0_g1_i1:507-1871(-)